MFWIICILFCYLGGSVSLHAADQDAAKYEEALQLARDGQHNTALPILKQLTEQFPEKKIYFYEYIIVLGWAERDAEVLSLQPQIDLERAPVYLLEIFGKSARNLQNFPLAIQVYRMAVDRAPDRLESQVGLALAHADNGESFKAVTLLDVLQNQHPERIDILESLAYVYRIGEKTVEELVVYQRILEIDPTHRGTRRQLILITARLGAPHLAASMAQKAPDLLTDEELEGITGDQVVQSIRWGGLYNPSPQDQFSDTDRAIQLLQDQLQHLDGRGEAASPAYRRARFDLIIALRDRQRFKEAISIYKELKGESSEIPNYVKLAIADVYMHQKKPDVARDIYLNLLKQNSDDYDTKIALFYALFDTGEYTSALDLIDTLAKEQKDPARRLRAESVAIMGYAWSVQLAEAQRRLEPLVERAPNNPYLQSNLGYLYLWRGWPRRAEEIFRLSKAIEPEVLDAYIGEIGVARELSEFRKADEKIKGLQRRYPDNTRVKRLTRDWKFHNMRELYVEVSHGQSSGVQEGSKDLTFDVTLYSRPIGDHIRIFGQNYYTQAEFPEGKGYYSRYGFGVEYRARDVALVGILSADAGLGLRLNGHWMPNDFWMFSAHVDTYSNEVPLRGRKNEDVDGWSVGLNTDYRFHESRAVGVGLQFLNFSDTNERFVYFASLFQRLIIRPTYKLDSRLGLFGSTNSLDAVDASYYNPGSDLSVELTLTNEWPLYRYYAVSLIHRLGGSIGNYHQSGFGSEGFWGFHYEHQWGITDRLGLSYGISWSQPVYDGVREDNLRFTFTLDWRF